MKIWITRHGQTDLNKEQLMQGLTDIPLNATGIEQAKRAHKALEGIHFDAVYASPLQRAIQTASLMAGIPEKDVKVDSRIIEVNFGNYEGKKYTRLGFKMTSYWLLPEVIPNPKSVESIDSMVKRSQSFLKEIEKKEYENVLIVCHGGIIRTLCGYLEDKRMKWRPKPDNCEIRVYESKHGQHRFIQSIKSN